MFTVESYVGFDGAPLRYGMITGMASPEPGQAAPVLLYVPGLGGSVKGALSFLEAMRPLFGAIYGVDLRGFGLNSQTTVPAPARFVDDLDAFWRARSLQDAAPVTLCGVSLGAIVATHMALTYPERFSRLMLIVPAFKPHRDTFPAHYALRRIAGRLLCGPTHATTIPYTIARLTRNPALLNAPDPLFVPPTVPTDFLLAVRPLAAAAFSGMARLTMPTFVVTAGADQVCDPHAMRRAYERIRAPKALYHYSHLKHDVFMEPEAPQIAVDAAAWLQSPELCPPAPVPVLQTARSTLTGP